MKVVFYLHNVGAYHAPRLVQLQESLARRGHELLVVEGATHSAFYDHKQSRAGALKSQLNITSLSSTSRNVLLKKLMRLLVRQRPDVILQLGYHDLPSLLTLCCAKLIRSRIYFCSDSKKDDQARSRRSEMVKSFVVKRFNGAMVAGSRHRDYFSELGLAKERIEIGYDVIDNDFFANRAQAFKKKRSLIQRLKIVPDRYVLVVSRLVPRKRVDLALQLYAQSDLPKQGVELVIIGSGPLEENIKEKMTQLGIEDFVHLRKNVDNKHMPMFYALAEASMLVSEYDQWGLCVNESMACGTPVLLTERCGAANEIVHHHKNGYVWDGEDVQQGAALLNQIALNPEIQAKFRTEVANTMREWGLKKFAEGITQLIIQ